MGSNTGYLLESFLLSQVLLNFLVANLQNRALSLHGVVVLQPPGVGLQAVPTCRVALIGLSPLL